MVAVVVDQDQVLPVLLADQVVVEVDQVVVVDRKQQLQLIQVPLNMEMLVVPLVTMVLVVVEQEVLVNHIPISQTEWDGAV
tara:strand:+ start:169 stop:411 length:243 start_codon:yes stop_codon:yes gene_type:complete